MISCTRETRVSSAKKKILDSSTKLFSAHVSPSWRRERVRESERMREREREREREGRYQYRCCGAKGPSERRHAFSIYLRTRSRENEGHSQCAKRERLSRHAAHAYYYVYLELHALSVTQNAQCFLLVVSPISLLVYFSFFFFTFFFLLCFLLLLFFFFLFSLSIQFLTFVRFVSRERRRDP